MQKQSTNQKTISTIAVVARLLANILFIASGTICAAVLAVRGTDRQILIVAFLAALIYAFLAFYYRLLTRLFFQSPIQISYLLISLLLTASTLPPKIQAFQQRLPNLANQLAYMINWRLPKEIFTAQIISSIISIFTGLAFFIFFYWLLNRFAPAAKSFFKNLDKVEKSYLLIFILIWAILIPLIFSQTSVFYAPQKEDKIIYYDVIFTADTGIHLATDIYQNLNAPENDIRQPLFGLYALPFGATAQLAAKIVGAVSGKSVNSGNTYPIICNFLQIALLGISAILLSRLMNFSGKAEKSLYLAILSFSYPFLLFSLNMEQYVFALFWLILFIYEALQGYRKTAAQSAQNITAEKPQSGTLTGNTLAFWPDKNLWYIGATGSLLTSGILFPLLALPQNAHQTISYPKASSLLVKYIKPLIACALQFFAITTLAGQLPLFLTAIGNVKKLLRFAGTHIGWTTKINQYTHFVVSCFTAPKAGVNLTAYNHVSFQLETISTPNPLGVILLLLATTGFMLQRRKPIARLSFSWLLFSFLLLACVGWGALENGLILYSLYFSWAFINLTFMAIASLLAKGKSRAQGKIKAETTLSFSAIRLLFLLLLVMATANIQGIMKIIQFGLTYYPVR